METSRTAFFVHSFDSDAFGRLSAVALAGYLQEAAGRSADNLGFGLRDLNRQSLTWVLVREHFELDEPVYFGDTLEVETWPSGIDRWAALRDFRLFKNQREVGRALSSWFVLDLVNRHPVRPRNILPEEYHEQAVHVLPLRADPLTTVGTATLERQFHVRFSDIDANLHVTNASYIAWVMESVTEAEWRNLWLRSLDIEFLAECALGAVVNSRSLSNGETHLHSVFREQDSKELAREVTVWNTK